MVKIIACDAVRLYHAFLLSEQKGYDSPHHYAGCPEDLWPHSLLIEGSSISVASGHQPLLIKAALAVTEMYF